MGVGLAPQDQGLIMARKKTPEGELPGYIKNKRPGATKRRPNAPKISAMCPRCKGMDTIATSTKTFSKHREHHRICRSPVCQHRYFKIVML